MKLSEFLTARLKNYHSCSQRPIAIVRPTQVKPEEEVKNRVEQNNQINYSQIAQ
ncbi:myosin-IIIa isoform X6, partial [Clarias magur]